MNQTTNNYQLLITKLDQFIRKFYINKLIKGSLYTVGLIFGLFLLYSLLESQYYFSTGTRKFLFLSFVGTAILSLGWWVINPLVRYFRLGKTISHEQAANIIGDHFTGVQDKLTNILQLKKQSESSTNAALIAASIDQKSEEIKPVPFRSAIDLSKNRQYLKYALPPFLLFITLLFAAPSLIKDSSYRILNNDKEFEREAPFSFLVENENIKVPQFEDYTLSVKVEGLVIPSEVFVEIDNFQYRLDKIDNANFAYTFRNMQKDTKFRLNSGSVKGKERTIDVIEKPILTDFLISLNYPSYLGRTNETLQSVGDLIIPEGTKVIWDFTTEYTDKVAMKFNGKEAEVNQKSKSEYSYAARIRSDNAYKIYISNKDIPTPDSMAYAINVVKDQYPVISAEQFTDSTNAKLIYFVGNASDDYGLNSLSFNYTITDDKGRVKPENKIKINKSEGRETQYTYTFDINELQLNPGDNVNYYFEVYDNDAVNGSKSAKTGLMSYAKPTLEEIKDIENANEEEIKDKLKESKENVDKLQEKFKKMREDLLQKKEMDWQDKKEMEKLIEQQKELQEQLQQAKDKFDQNMKNQEEFQKPSEKIQEKQQKLEEMFQQALDPEKQDMLDKIQELMQELEKEDALEMMEQFEMNNEMMQENMEKLEELYKQLEMEKEVNELTDELEKLAEEQEKLAEETAEEKKPEEELKKEQEKVEEKFEELKEKMEELEKKNEELSPPKDLGEDNEEKMDEISDEMDDAQEKMENSDSKGASESQKGASEKMKKMAGSLQSSMESGDQEQQMEDIKAIRQLLENLITVSFDQESLINNLENISTTIPKYVELVQEQFKLKDDFSIIEDSLSALARRNDKIESFVTDKVVEIKYNFRGSLEQLEARSVPQANQTQRRTMTNLNDLALMLSESMEDMQQSASGGMPGSQMCNKPGGKGAGKSGKVPMDKITEGQDGMSKKLSDMKGKQGSGGSPSAKDFAEAAAKQAALRKALQDIQKDKMEQGKGDGGLQDIIDQMDKNEIDLVNKKLNNEMFKRQSDIVTRLLEAEKAERQREFDNKRKGETGEEKKKELPPALQEYLKKREAEIEMYKTVSPSLKPYYRYLVDEYYKALKKS